MNTSNRIYVKTRLSKSHLGRYCTQLQNEVKCVILGVSFASCISISGIIYSEPDMFVLMAIWSILLPAAILVFHCIGITLGKYIIAPTKQISYSGNYQDLVSKLFSDGFQFDIKVDNYYQFKSSLPRLKRHALIVSKGREQCRIFGSKYIIEELEKDMITSARRKSMFIIH